MSGQLHSCGSAAERRLPRPQASPDLTFGPLAPELCAWCGIPLVAGENLHVCGGRAAAENDSDNENL